MESNIGIIKVEPLNSFLHKAIEEYVKENPTSLEDVVNNLDLTKKQLIESFDTD